MRNSRSSTSLICSLCEARPEESIRVQRLHLKHVVKSESNAATCWSGTEPRAKKVTQTFYRICVPSSDAEPIAPATV
jgi:hypothetical protein